MHDLAKEIGIRLRNIRQIAAGGQGLTSDEFGLLLEETGERIRNYETGRTLLNVKLLIKLYDIGYNPIYILKGEGSIFADNEQGKLIKDNIFKSEHREIAEVKLFVAAAGEIKPKR